MFDLLHIIIPINVQHAMQHFRCFFFFNFLNQTRFAVKYQSHSPIDGSDEFLVPSADIDRACPGDRPYKSLYFSCWLASIDLDLNLDLLNRVLMAPKKSRFFFLLRPRSPEKHGEQIWIEQQYYYLCRSFQSVVTVIL